MLFQNSQKRALRSEEISLFFVSSRNTCANQLGALLKNSDHDVHVEWVNASRGYLIGLMERLVHGTANVPSIVLFDFQDCGAMIWQFIARCTEMLPDFSIEWFVTNYSGPAPAVADFPWQNVTILGEAGARN